MRKKQVTQVIEKVCNMIENDIIGNPNAVVDAGAILCGDNIDDYEIERISKVMIPTPEYNVAVCVRFHTKKRNIWHGKYFLFKTYIEMSQRRKRDMGNIKEKMYEMVQSDILEEMYARGYDGATMDDAKRVFQGMMNNECVNECFAQIINEVMDEKI